MIYKYVKFSFVTSFSSYWHCIILIIQDFPKCEVEYISSANQLEIDVLDSAVKSGEHDAMGFQQLYG